MARLKLLHAFPDCFGAGMTVVFAPEKAAEAGDQAHHLTQGWGVSGGGQRWATIQAACHSSGSNTTSHGKFGQSRPQVTVQGAPGDGQVNHQGPFQPLQRPQLQRLDPAAYFPNPEKISISQRLRYQSTSCTTSSSVSAGRLVSSRHTSAGCPVGGCSSRARIAVTVTAG